MSAEGSAPSTADRLDSWKEIAAYLGRGVRTVQRWERAEGLPVRRLGQDRTGPVFAYKSEIDAWWEQQSRRLSPDSDAEPEIGGTKPIGRIHWRTGLLFAAASIAVALAIGIILQKPGRGEAPYRPVPFTVEHGWEVEPTFSPDGRQIAYVSATQGVGAFIYVKAIGRDVATRLTNGKQNERSPAWSPDGRLIAFVRRPDSGNRQSIILIPAAGGPESLVAEVTLAGGLIWSADGRWLLTLEGDPRAKAIVAISAATGARHSLTAAYEFAFCGYGLSPDLRRLIFCRGGPGASTIYEMPLGPELKPAGPPKALVSKIWLREMVVTADAKQVIYTDGIFEEGIGLFRLCLTPDAKPELIHSTPDRYMTPAISRDQRRVAFAVSRSYREETWKLQLDDPRSQPVPLLSTTHSDMNPDYSPDGRTIAFHSTRSGASDIWIAKRDGSEPRRLTFTNARTTATPRWSPDGGWIAFESNDVGQTEVYVIRSSGGPVQRITNNTATDAIPSWSRDGRMLYFCSDRTGRFEIWKVPAFGGEPVQVTRNGGFLAIESPDGKYLYYSQTRSLGPVWRMSLPAGQPELVIPEVRGLFFAVTSAGVYFQANRAIQFWDAASRQTREISALRKAPGYGLAVSPDGKELLFAQVDAQTTDLYLIDGLR